MLTRESAPAVEAKAAPARQPSVSGHRPGRPDVARSAEGRGTPGHILDLQRVHGNRFVQRTVRPPRGAGADASTGRLDVAPRTARRNAPDRPTPAGGPTIQRAWYNFDIPFTDYQFDPSTEGLKTAGNLALDKAKEGATWARDKVVAAAQWVWDRISGLVNSGIDWLSGKFGEIKGFAVSSFADIKAALSAALGAINNPLAFLTSAMAARDAGLLSTAWRAVTSGANAVWRTVKGVVDGVLAVGGGLWAAVSGMVDTLFGAVDDLLDSTAFGLLPDALQDSARALTKRVRNLWTSVRDYWKDLWKRLTDFTRQLLQSVESFVKKVMSYAIDKVVETVRKLREGYDTVRKFATDPESAIKPVLAGIAARIQAEAPGKSREVAQQKMAEAGASGTSALSSSGSLVVQRSPDGAAAIRSTASRADIDAALTKSLGEQWAGIDFVKMLWDTVVNMFWPPALIRSIGHEFYELWNSDWAEAASGLFAPRSIAEDFAGFWHDVWSNFLVLLDFPLALWRRLNSVLMLLSGYVSIFLVVAGFAAGGPVGAAAGAQLALQLGMALMYSFVGAEAISAIKAYLDLTTARQTATEKQRDYTQFAASVCGIGVALVISLLFWLLGALARQVAGLIKARGTGAPKPLPGPRQAAEGEGATQENKPVAEAVVGKAALEADIGTAQAAAGALRDALRQTPRATERVPLDARAAEIQDRLARLQEEAARAASPDDVQRGRQRLEDIRKDLDAVRQDARVAEVPGRLSLQQDAAAARQRAAGLRRRVDALNGNDQRALRPSMDEIDAKLASVEPAAQNVPTAEQAQRLRDVLDGARKQMDDMERHPLLELGLRGEVLEALKSLENIKKDPVGEVNREVTERGNPKNHYEASRREARGDVVARRPNGTPYSHIGDLQRAFDGLDNVRRALERELDHPAASLTERGLNVLSNKLSEVQGMISRLKGFLDSIGHGTFPPYHVFPPGT